MAPEGRQDILGSSDERNGLGLGLQGQEQERTIIRWICISISVSMYVVHIYMLYTIHRQYCILCVHIYIYVYPCLGFGVSSRRGPPIHPMRKAKAVGLLAVVWRLSLSSGAKAETEKPDQ